ncbi:MAG: ATP-binding protein [Oscillospiraceae bacterium]|nr:ATP-binding protein [Oscillospiraceae bacterium]
MPRLIPGRTKVHIELFRGVSLRDIVVGVVAMAMLIFVLLSNLPGKLWIGLGIVMLTALLLIRLDEQPNYLYFLHILSFIGYHRHFERYQKDDQLLSRGKSGRKEAAIELLFQDQSKTGEEPRRSRREAEKARKNREAREDRLLRNPGTPEEIRQEILKRRREAEEQQSIEAARRNAAALETEQSGVSPKDRAKQRKEEDKLLKSAAVSDQEKEAIRARRAEESRQAMIRQAKSREDNANRRDMEEIIAFTGIREGFIEYLNKQYYGAVLEIDPVEFRFFSEHRRINSIERCLGRVLRSIHAGYSANIVKLERPIMYDRYLQREYDKVYRLRDSYENGVLSEEELKARVEIEYDRIRELQSYCGEKKVTDAFYYLVLFESDKLKLENQIRDAQQLLTNGEMTVRRLDDKELAVFLKYTNQIDFDERDIENIAPEDYALWAQPEIVDMRVRRVEINHIVTHNFRVVNYPAMVNDAWLAGVMSYPGTKVVVKCRPMERGKAIRAIDHSLIELRGQWSSTGVDSRRMEIENHINSLQELLSTLQSDSETLLECSIYITAYDIVATRANLKIPQPPESTLPTINEMKKNVRRVWQESGFRLNNMEFDQVQAFIGAQVNALDPLEKEARGISSNTMAACFPWVYAHISDEGGVKLGESDGLPVFIDFFRRDSERVNSNMVIVGKSGSGKSYATKSLLANLAAEDAKIYILDPENEYQELANNLHGKIINVGNAQYGRLNPFHIITALEDDEAGEEGPSGSYATHLQFLEEFFRQIMPDCGKDAMEYLNTLVDRVYLTHNITPDTDLSRLQPEDYPIFDDLYDEVLREFQSSDNPFTRDLLRSLMNYIAKFSTGGRNANIWNGPSTVTTEENFTVFNFQSMLANRNTAIANAQMLLVLKYLDNEIIKNRDYNAKYKADRKIVVVIDEAHVFIDTKFPIALDFMFQLAKRIRKYNGMQIVITQNIKDFVGSEELARKSTAIINACQYSFIFSLAPNDMQDLVTLYEKAGGINETEQEQIVQAPRGQAFTIISPTARSTFQIETNPGIIEMFENRDFRSAYFEGETGAGYWEDFVADSRQAHEAALAERRSREAEAGTQSGVGRGSVTFREFDEEEYRSQLGAPEESESAPEELPDLDDAAIEARLKSRREAMNSSLQTVSSENGPMTEMLGLFASAVNKMSEAIDNLGTDRSAAPIPAPIPQSAADSGSPALQALEARLNAQADELRRLQQENASLRAGQDGKPAPSSLPEEQEEPEYPEEELDLSQEAYGEEDYSPEAEGSLLESLLDQDEEDNFDLFLDVDFDQEDEEDEDQEDEESDEDEDADENNDEAAGDLEEDEDDILSSFYSFANELKTMNVFEKMRFDGRTVETISFQDLEGLVRDQQERRRRERLNAVSGQSD